MKKFTLSVALLFTLIIQGCATTNPAPDISTRSEVYQAAYKQAIANGESERSARYMGKSVEIANKAYAWANR